MDSENPDGCRVVTQGKQTYKTPFVNIRLATGES